MLENAEKMIRGQIERYDGDMVLDSLVTGRCDKCGDVLQVDEDGWSGEDGAHHYPEYAKGGGDIKRIECGRVWRI